MSTAVCEGDGLCLPDEQASISGIDQLSCPDGLLQVSKASWASA